MANIVRRLITGLIRRPDKSFWPIIDLYFITSAIYISLATVQWKHGLVHANLFGQLSAEYYFLLVGLNRRLVEPAHRLSVVGGVC